jgi:hypothetical protein
MAGAKWQTYDEKHPFGKGAIVISQDNISHAEMRRSARNRINHGQGTPQDYELVSGAEALIQQALLEKQEGDDD